MIIFTIHQKLPSLNEFIEANRTSALVGARMKKTNQTYCEWDIRSQLKGVQAREPVKLRFAFYEENQKRDMDNISGFAHKVIRDALVCQNVIQNDGWKNIAGYTDDFYVTNGKPMIEVIILENGEY